MQDQGRDDKGSAEDQEIIRSKYFSHKLYKHARNLDIMIENDKFSLFVKQFTQEPILNVRRVGRNYYLADDALWAMKEKINKDIYSIGVFLGEEKQHLIPSPALLDIIAQMPGSERKKVFVNKKAEWLFMCGRNVLSDSIVKMNVTEGVVLVQNEKDENLGYGLLKKEDQLIIKNLLDKGYYLRVDDKKGHRKKK